MQSFNLKSLVNREVVFRLSLVFITGIFLPVYHAGAQQLTVQQIDKIILNENEGGMGGGITSSYTITRNNTGWESSRTNKSSTLISHKTGKWENSDSAQIKFVAKINPVVVNRLVYAINHPIKSFSPDLFGITEKFLKTHADSILKSTFYQPTAQQIAMLKQEITGDRINQAITRLQQSDYTDVADIVKMAIVKKNGDTLKIESTSLESFKLPWKVPREGDVYNLAISRFCAGAMNGGSHSLLNGGHIYGDICSDIYDKYCKDRVTAAYFREHFATAFKQLESCYTISGINTSDILQAGDPIVFMQLHGTTMPENANVSTALRIKHNNDVARLVNTKGKFDSLLKQKNFLLDFVLHSPGYRLTIEDPNDSLSQYNWHQSNYPYLKDFPQASIMEFRIQNKTSEDEYSQWTLLPNGQLVLLWLSGQKVLNFTRQQLNLDKLPPFAVETCVIFDPDGKILYNFTR